MIYTRISADDVQKVLERHLLVDGFPIVVDLERSRGSWMKDAASGRTFLDFYTFFASAPLGFNHPRLLTPEFQDRLARAATSKPANSDTMSVELAEFVEALERIAIPEDYPHYFFVEGGALAVENAMKTAFDWKARLNEKKGVHGGGDRILHFREAFHGRSGYTLSVTNTDPVKTLHFPKFDWPRIENPKIIFPLEGDNLAAVEMAEKSAVEQMTAALDADPYGIAAILIEPIQCEGGDNHFRPEFFRELRRIADERDALLIFDEIQTGVGATGKMWAFEHCGVRPDIVAFAKKMQVGGIFVNRRIEEVEDHVFEFSSRINSTWGGGLVDMVRATEILEIIEDENLVENAAQMGERLLEGLHALQTDYPELVSNARGLGLITACDLPDTEGRDAFITGCMEEGLIALKCGPRSARFRPALNVKPEEIEEALARIRRAVDAVFTIV